MHTSPWVSRVARREAERHRTRRRRLALAGSALASLVMIAALALLGADPQPVNRDRVQAAAERAARLAQGIEETRQRLDREREERELRLAETARPWQGPPR